MSCSQMNPRVGVVTFCVRTHPDFRADVLLHRRTEAARDEQGRWDVGGGALEYGETPQQAVYREIREEFGLTRADLVCPPELQAVVNVLRTGSHWVSWVYRVDVSMRAVVENCEPDKHELLGWQRWDPSAWPSPAHSMLRPIESMVYPAGSSRYVQTCNLVEDPDRGVLSVSGVS